MTTSFRAFYVSIHLYYLFAVYTESIGSFYVVDTTGMKKRKESHSNFFEYDQKTCDARIKISMQKKSLTLWSNSFVGATGFEPAAAWSQTRSATGLRYAPLAFLSRKASAKVRNKIEPCKFFPI